MFVTEHVNSIYWLIWKIKKALTIRISRCGTYTDVGIGKGERLLKYNIQKRRDNKINWSNKQWRYSDQWKVNKPLSDTFTFWRKRTNWKEYGIVTIDLKATWKRRVEEGKGWNGGKNKLSLFIRKHPQFLQVQIAKFSRMGVLVQLTAFPLVIWNTILWFILEQINKHLSFRRQF